MNVVKVKDVVADKKFAVVDGPFGTQLHADEYVESGVPIVRVKNIGWGPFIHTDLKYITEEKAVQIERSTVYPGDIVIAKTGATIGKTCIFPNTFEKAIIASSCAKISLDPQKALNRYVYRFLLSPRGYSQIIGQSAGSTRSTIGLKGINALKIPLPPLEEQKKIAAILDAADDYRQKTKALIDKYDQLAQSLFLDMFGYLEGDRVLLGSICEINPKKKSISNLDKSLMVSFVPMANVSEEGKLTLEYERTLESVWSGFTYFQEDDVVFAKITPCMENGKGAIMRGLTNYIGFGTTEFHVLRPMLHRSNSEYLFYLTHSSNFRKLAELNMSGSAGQKRVPKDFLSSYNIVAPPFELQNLFAERVAQIKKQKQQAEASLVKAEELFNSLLQRAFKGELTN